MTTEISLEVRNMIGAEKVRTYEVTARDIRRFAQAIGASEVATEPDGTLVAPPLICQVFMFEDVPVEDLPPDGSPTEIDVPVPATRVVGGESEFEILGLVRDGDRITFRSRLKSVRAQRGKSGWLYFVVVETSFNNQHGNTVAREIATYVKRI